MSKNRKQINTTIQLKMIKNLKEVLLFTVFIHNIFIIYYKWLIILVII